MNDAIRTIQQTLSDLQDKSRDGIDTYSDLCRDAYWHLRALLSDRDEANESARTARASLKRIDEMAQPLIAERDALKRERDEWQQRATRAQDQFAQLTRQFDESQLEAGRLRQQLAGMIPPPQAFESIPPEFRIYREGAQRSNTEQLGQSFALDARQQSETDFRLTRIATELGELNRHMGVLMDAASIVGRQVSEGKHADALSMLSRVADALDPAHVKDSTIATQLDAVLLELRKQTPMLHRIADAIDPPGDGNLTLPLDEIMKSSERMADNTNAINHELLNIRTILARIADEESGLLVKLSAKSRGGCSGCGGKLAGHSEQAKRGLVMEAASAALVNYTGDHEKAEAMARAVVQAIERVGMVFPPM